MNIKSLSLLTLGLLAPALLGRAAEETEPTLKPGLAAPALKVSQWVKGGPVDKLEPGKVYVVEFWATWCGPCRTSIPHLTEVAKKFKGKAEVIGVSVWEREKEAAALKEKVTKFVESMGDKMDYHVAMDTEDAFMAKEWMKAGGQNGIPAAFIVGKDGKVQWIGHPMDGLEEALEQIVAGTFDLKAAAAEKDKKDAAQKKLQTAMQEITSLSRDGKAAEALAAYDKLVAENPDMAKRFATMRLNLLLAADPKAGVAAIRKLSEGEAKDQPAVLLSLARMLSNPKLKDGDTALAVSLAERAKQLTPKPDVSIEATCADALFANGNTDKAIAAIEEAIKLVKADKEAPPSYLDFLNQRLEKFQAARK